MHMFGLFIAAGRIDAVSHMSILYVSPGTLWISKLIGMHLECAGNF